MPTAGVAATATGFGFGIDLDEAVSDATGVIETVVENDEVIAFPRQTNQGFGDDLDIPDFLK